MAESLNMPSTADISVYKATLYNCQGTNGKTADIGRVATRDLYCWL
jgi:hypothetical protein